ncbi:hypothetical protein ACLOJK_033724 [Asimina triloba]
MPIFTNYQVSSINRCRPRRASTTVNAKILEAVTRKTILFENANAAAATELTESDRFMSLGRLRDRTCAESSESDAGKPSLSTSGGSAFAVPQMIVRWRRMLAMSDRKLENPLLKSLDSLFFSSKSAPEKERRDCYGTGFPATRFILTPHVVESTLSRCPSDILSLSFFLWFARQPNYFHDPRSFDCIVPIVVRLVGRLESVKGIIGELERIGCPTKAQTFLVLLRIFWRGGLYGLALEAFHEMSSFGFVPNTFARNIAIDVLFKIGRTDLAWKVFRETQFPNFLTFNTAICNLSKLNDCLGVWGILRLMMGQGFFPNSGTFSMVMNCFCKAGRLVEALQVLGLMITSGIQLSVTIWSILIDGFCKIGRVDSASQLLRHVVDSSSFRPNIVTYTSLVKGFFEARMFDEAFDVLNEMESQGCQPDLVLYNMLIGCLCKVGMYDEAIDVVSQLLEKNLRPDSYTFSSLLSVICSSREFVLLPALVRGLDVTGDLMACNSLLNVFCKAGFPLNAVAFYNSMIDRGFRPDNYSYTGLLTALCRAGLVDYAVDVYLGIIANGSVLDAHVHTVVLDGLIKAGKFRRAIELFRKAIAENQSVDSVTYSVAINGLFKEGRSGEACSLFIQMKEAGFLPNICTYNVMLCGLSKTRDMNTVKWLVEDMADAGIQPDSTSFNALIGSLSRSCRVRSALRLFIEMCKLGLKPNEATYTSLVQGLHQVAEVDDARLLLKHYLEDEDVVFVDSSGFELYDMLLSRGEALEVFHKLTGNQLINGSELEEKNRECVLCA